MLELATVLTLVFCTFFLPGYVFFDFLFSRAQKDGLEVFFLRVLLSVLLTSGVALLLADFGVFSLLRVLGLLALVSGVAALGRRILPRVASDVRSVITQDGWALLLVLVGAALLFARPHEYLLGGWDPGVYLQTGAHIASTGGINFHDAILAAMDPAARDLFLANKGWPELVSGFRVISGTDGFVSPQFQHLYSCWIALFHGAAGLPLALRVNALFALLAVLAFYLAGRTLFDGMTGLLAAVLLAGNVAEIWFARFSTSEIVAQFFVWSGLYLLALHLRGERTGYGIVGACCFGAAWLAHISALFLALPLLAVVFYRVAAGFLRRDLPLLLALLGCGVLVVLQNRYVSLGYSNLINYARWMVHLYPGWIAAALLVVALLIGLGRGDPGRIDRLLNHKSIRAGLVLALVGLSLYAYVLRPHIVASSPAASVLEGDELKRLLSNSMSVRDLCALFTPLGLCMGIVGAAWIAWRGLTGARAPVFLIVLTVCVIVLYDKQVEPFYMFGARRFLIVVIPAVCLCVAYGLAALWRLSWRGGKPLALACLVVVLIVPMAHGRNAVMVRDYEGLTAFCRQVADLLPPGRDRRVLLCDHEGLAAPLRFIHGENALVVRATDDRGMALLGRQILAWQEAGREVFYLSEEDRPYTREWEFVALGGAHFESARLEHAARFFPSESIRYQTSPQLFHLQPRDPLLGGLKTGECTRIKVGQVRFGIAGLQQPEVLRTFRDDFRWTHGAATFLLGEVGFSPAMLRIRMASARPARENDVTVKMSLNGEALPAVRVRPGSKFGAYEVMIPKAVAERVSGQKLTLALSCDTWNPARAGVSRDGRDLGVMVDSICLLDPAMPERQITVDIGLNDDERHAGVYRAESDVGSEVVGTRTLRRLDGTGEVVIPWVEASGNARLNFSLECGRAVGPPARLEVLVDGQEVGNLALQPRGAVYQVEVASASLSKWPRGRAVLGFRLWSGSGDAATSAMNNEVAVEWVQVEAR